SAKSSSDQCVVGSPCSAGGVVARHITLCRSSGGKSSGAARAWEILQALQPLAMEASSPLGDGVGITVQIRRHTLIGRLVVLDAADNDACAESEGLRR